MAGREWPVSHLPWQSVRVFLWFLTWYLSLQRWERSLSTWWCQLQEQEHPCTFLFHSHACGGLQRPNPLYDESHDLSFLASCRSPCPAWQSTPFQPDVHLCQAWLHQPAACPLPLTPRSRSAGPGEIPSLTPTRELLLAFPCKSWEVPEHQVHLRRATGTCWDLARLMPASAPPCAGNSQVFNYSSLWEAAGNTGDFGGCWLGSSAASSPCFL